MDIHFARAQAAQELAKSVLGKTFLGAPTVFLSGPRRTGKSRFLQRDVIPEIEDQGGCAIYVDLWKNKNENPTRLISHAIASKLAERQGAVRRAAAAVGLSKVSIHGVEFDLSAVGDAPGAALADALAELHNVAGQPLVLIIDEAQQVIADTNAMNLMFALKSARDTMNAHSHALGLIMSGSDRDKLIRLVNGNAAPFLGSDITPLPLLDARFTNYIAGLIVQANPRLRIDNQRLYSAFTLLNHQPEFLLRALQHATHALAGPEAEMHERIDAYACRFQNEQQAKYADTYNSLSVVQQALLTQLLSGSGADSGKLFTAAALAEYGALKGNNRPMSPGSAREELNRMRNCDPPIIWRSSWGEYAAEDSGMTRWYQQLHAAGQWPPA